MNVIDTVNHIENKDIHDLLLKFIIIGDSYVGKSNLLLQYTNKKFSECHDVTIGVEFGLKTVPHMDKIYKIQLWDTAGQETFKALTRNYYRNAIGCLLVYDIGRRESFDHISEWVKDIKEYSNEHIIVVLVGNKSDSERQVSYEEGKEYADENDMDFFETSAKNGVNVEKAFNHIIKIINDKIDSKEIDESILIMENTVKVNNKSYCFCL